jgi:hypothetical protein
MFPARVVMGYSALIIIVQQISTSPTEQIDPDRDN